MKTWEMLRDINPGEIWEVTTRGYDDLQVALGVFEDYGNECLIFVSSNYAGESFLVTKHTLNYEWRKVPVLVPFAEAFAVFDHENESKRKAIRSTESNDMHKPDKEHWKLFTAQEIRGMWEIIE